MIIYISSEPLCILISSFNFNFHHFYVCFAMRWSIFLIYLKNLFDFLSLYIFYFLIFINFCSYLYYFLTSVLLMLGCFCFSKSLRYIPSLMFEKQLIFNVSFVLVNSILIKTIITAVSQRFCQAMPSFSLTLENLNLLLNFITDKLFIQNRFVHPLSICVVSIISTDNYF